MSRTSASDGGNRVPADLAAVARRFATWRAKRRRGDRIPDRLWREAAKLAMAHGASRTSSILQLDCYRLKRLASGDVDGGDDPGSGFVELPSPFGAPPSCVLEFEDRDGRKLRVHFSGTPAKDVIAVGRGLWRGGE